MIRRWTARRAGAGAYRFLLPLLLTFSSFVIAQQQASSPVVRRDDARKIISKELQIALSMREAMMLTRGVPDAYRFFLAPEPPVSSIRGDRAPAENRTNAGSDRFPYDVLHRDYGDHTACLFYAPYDAVNTDLLYGFFLSVDDLHESPLYWIVSTAAVEKAAQGVRDALYVDGKRDDRGVIVANRQPRQADSAALRGATNELSRLLIPPQLAPELLHTEHLIVAPSGVIGIVPFALLQPFGDDVMLIDRMSVSIAPSIFDILVPPEAWRFDFRCPLVVGNPTLPNSWAPLPGAEREAKVVAEILQTDAILGSQATGMLVRKRAPDADLLYFATHGVGGGLSGMIVFSGTDEEDRWDAQEIQRLKLRAKLAVLSGCQTGLGEAHDGGTIGLARAFQIAGVPRVVMSLWSVNDEATAELMSLFLDRARSTFPSQALRLAMLDLRKRRPRPSEWAPFTLFGLPR